MCYIWILFVFMLIWFEKYSFVSLYFFIYCKFYEVHKLFLFFKYKMYNLNMKGVYCTWVSHFDTLILCFENKNCLLPC